MNETTPKVSVIVPVYKAEAYLHRCVDSLLAQTFQDFEILLVNDGSPDRSGKICDEYARKDARVKVFHNENKGASFSRSYGVRQATGDYVCFVDADDSMPSDACQTLYDFSLKYQSDITIGGYKRIFSKESTDYCGFSFKSISNDIYLYYLLTGNWKLYGPVAKMFKKELFSLGFPDIPKEIRVGEDLLMNVFLASLATKVVFIPYSVYNYYQVLSSATHTFKYSVDYMLFYLQELEKILVQNQVPNKSNLLTHYKINIMYNVLLDDTNEQIDYHSEIINTLLNEVKGLSITSKEKLILSLIRYRHLRLFYRNMITNYRNGKGCFFLCKKALQAMRFQ